MRKFFSLIAAVLFAGGMMASVVTLDPSTQTDAPASSNTGDPIELTINGITIAYQGAVNASTAPADFRVYGNQDLTLSATSNISKVTIAGKANKAGWAPTVSAGEITTGASYEGITTKATLEDPLFVVENINAQSISITCNKQLRAYMIEVTLAEGGDVPPVEETCNWDEIAFLGNGSGNADYTDRFKLCADPAIGVINIQSSFGTEPGIYVTFPTAEFGAISLEEGQYAIQGAGMLLYVSAFLYDAEKEVTVVCGAETYTLTVKNANPETIVPVVEPTTCAAVYNMAKNDVVDLLNPVTVTYVNGKNVWVKDETAAMLLYLPANAEYAAGDVLTGAAGVVDIYNTLVYEIKPSADQVAAIVATAGEAPAAEAVAEVAATDVNKYIVMENVTAEGTFTESSQTNLTINGVTVRNQFKLAYTFEAGKTYNITGVVSAYQGTPQVYFISAEEAETPIVGVETIYDWAGEIGTTIFGGNSNITTGTVKIHENTDDVSGIKFGSSYVYADGKYIAIKPAEGGFKAGDVLSVSVVFNNSDVTKYCMVDVYAADQTTRLFRSDSASTLNGRNAGEPIVQTYTLAADQDSLLLGRYGNTGMFVTLLKVDRALVPPTPQPTINYYVAGSMNEWAANEAYILTPNNENLYQGEFTFAANDEFKVIGFDGENTTWFPEGMGNNFQITEAGDYKITFNPAGNVEGWYEGFFNVVKKEPIIVETISCADVYSKAKNDEVALNDVVVTYVNGKNVWVKDETGAMLLYLAADATWAAGDVLAGVEGVVDIYKGLYEVKPSADQVAAVVATPGEAPEPEELAIIDPEVDMNKYIILKEIAVEGTFTTDGSNESISIGEGLALFNKFKYAYVFEANKAYNVVGVVSIYNQNLQVNFISAEVADTPIEPLIIPTDAPVPTTAEDDVMAIYCNHYTTNNANFGISGWAGAYQTLDLNGINVGYWTGMTWECIIDPAHTDDPHDFSAYKNIHVDLWAPLPAKIKFVAEAVAGGNYKDGQVVEMQQGWNSVDFVVADWAGNYDFKNLKCFVFEQYQTLAGESFEGNPFAFANIYFYGKEEQGINNTDATVKAVKAIVNGNLIIEKNGVRYNVMGQIVK